MSSDQVTPDRDLGDLSPEPPMLSEREIEILRLAATGASNKQIAQRLFISANTVKVHMRNSFAKIGAASRTEAVVYAIQQGLVEGLSGSSPQLSAAKPGPGKRSVPPPRNWASHATVWYLRVVFGPLILIGIVWMILKVRGEQISGSRSEIPAASEARWKWRAELPMARSGLAVAAHEGLVYAIGGETSGGVTGAMDRYDPSNDTWTALPAKPTAVGDVKAAVIGGQIYVPGGRLSTGEVTDLFEVYDPQRGRWEARARLPRPLSGYGLVAFEGRIYLFGGWDGELFTSTVYEYRPQQDIWRARPPMPTARAYAGAVPSSEGIHVIGGYDGANALSVNEVYKPWLDSDSDNPWVQAEPMPQARYAMGIATLADIVYVIGGIGTGGRLPPLEYFPDRDEWIVLGTPVVSGWSHLGLAALGTQLYALGGRQGDVLLDHSLSYQAIYTIMIPVLPVGD